MNARDKPCEDSGESMRARGAIALITGRPRFAPAFFKALVATSLMLAATYVSLYFTAKAYTWFRHSEVSHELSRFTRDGIDMLFSFGYFGLGWFVVPGAATYAGLTCCANSSRETLPRLAGVYLSYLLSATVLIVTSGPNWIGLTVTLGLLPLVSSLPWILTGVLRLKLLPK